MGVCNCSMFCCTLLYVHSSIASILMGKRKLVALLNLSSWCLLMVGWPFLAVPWGCLRFVIVVFPDHTHLLFLSLPSEDMADRDEVSCHIGCLKCNTIKAVGREGSVQNALCRPRQ